MNPAHCFITDGLEQEEWNSLTYSADTYAHYFADSGLDTFPEYEYDIDQLFTEAFDSTVLPEACLPESENSHQVAAAHVPLVQSNQPHPPTTTSVRTCFPAPVNEPEIQRRRIDAVPQKNSTDIKYCVNVWEEWRKYRKQEQNSTIPPLSLVHNCSTGCSILFGRFGKRMKLNIHLTHSITGFLDTSGQTDTLLLTSTKTAFADFRTTLDAEMKRLQHKGIGSKVRQAEALSEDDEEILWSKGLLGDHSPQALLNTMVFMIGLYFALRSGREHRPYLLYTEDASKNRPGGLRGRYIPRKSVRHNCNE